LGGGGGGVEVEEGGNDDDGMEYCGVGAYDMGLVLGGNDVCCYEEYGF